MKKFLCTLGFVCGTLMTMAQSADSFKNIQIIEDPNISKFYPPKETANASNDVSNKGFRVQIFDGNSKTKASDAKAKFAKKYPGVRSYLKFYNPQYRVRVGDFKTRDEAEKFQDKIKKDFAVTMVIPDQINAASSAKPKAKKK